MKREIEDLREKLNREIEKGELSYEEILRISQELDKVIVEFYKEKSN